MSVSTLVGNVNRTRNGRNSDEVRVPFRGAARSFRRCANTWLGVSSMRPAGARTAEGAEVRCQGSGGPSLGGSRSVSGGSASAQRLSAPACHSPHQALQGIAEDMGASETGGRRQQGSEPAGRLSEVSCQVHEPARAHNALHTRRATTVGPLHSGKSLGRLSVPFSEGTAAG